MSLRSKNFIQGKGLCPKFGAHGANKFWEQNLYRALKFTNDKAKQKDFIWCKDRDKRMVKDKFECSVLNVVTKFVAH